MNSEKLKRCYQVLEVEPGASQQQIKQSYRDLVRVWHPDRFQGDPALAQRAQEKLKEINLAYELLLEFLEARVGSKEHSGQDNPPTGPADAAEAYQLGESFYFGEGRAKDYSQAVYHLRKSADLGYSRAQALLGMAYYHGQGVTKDVGLAVEWWTRASEQGHPIAQHSLGCIYRDNYGGSLLSKVVGGVIDYKVGDGKIEAYKWFNLSLSNGYAEACSDMARLSSHLSNEQINEARRRAQRFYPNYGYATESDAVREWLEYYVLEIKMNPKHRGQYQEMESSFGMYQQIESEVVRETIAIIRDKFFGKKTAQAKTLFAIAGSNWGRLFGRTASREEFVKQVAYYMTEQPWDMFSADFLCRREGITNYLWLKLYAAK